MPSHWTLAYAQLRRCVPKIFKPGTCLYVGASRDKFANSARELIKAGRVVTILEIWRPNVEFYQAQPSVAYVVQGDVRQVDKLNLPHYDLCMWFHGPEHIPYADLPATLTALEALADLVVLACPYGMTVQRADEMRGNPHQAHLAGLLPADFTALGYQVDTFGREADWNACNLLAWKATK
jgi:hypothetical protein